MIFQTIFRKHPGMYDVIGGGHSLGDEVALNPQPLPPRSASEQLVSSLPPSILDQVALNPQPLPPKDFDAVALNPQPLPPRESVDWR